jgi:FdrA protein
MAENLSHRILPGTYLDSLVLMRLHRALEELPGVAEAAAVMATAANRELLAERGLLPPEAEAARPDDLLVAVKAASPEAAAAALGRVDELLAERTAPAGAGEYRARSLDAALRMLPEARWVLVSVPGRWAAGVARDALAAGRNVFLYSDNVPLAEELALKAEAARRGLLVLGPDCGTALVGGAGLGFANRVRRGGIGIVAASGTGLQAVACGIDAAGEGISHALGTGGRDLSAEVGGATALQALNLLARDPETRVIVLVSKPPAPEVAARVLRAAWGSGKPTVVWFLGAPAPGRRLGSLWFASGSEDAAELAVALAREEASSSPTSVGEVAGGGESTPASEDVGPEAGRLVGLFSGGTLAAEVLLGLVPFLSPLASNLKAPGVRPAADLSDPAAAAAHVLLDLGADELTVGRPHPMLDPAILLERLRSAAADATVTLLLLDVVLGDGAHPDPASVLAPALSEVLERARRDGRELSAAVILVGAAADPQDRESQAERLRAAGARVAGSVAEAVSYALAALPSPPDERPRPAPVPLAVLAAPVAAVNVGLEVFYTSLLAQGARAAQVDWRPPAGGDERLARILERTKRRGGVG